MDTQRLQELAALHAVGALDGEDADEFQRLVEARDAFLQTETSAFAKIAAALAESLPIQHPAPELKEKILRQIAARAEQAGRSDPHQQAPEAAPGYRIIRQNDRTGWRTLKVQGASVKLLSLDRTRGYAVVLGQLEPGARYPAHTHSGPEEVYVLSGDLHMEGRVLQAGDFHHADAGTSHGENFSEGGCTIIAVLSAQDLLAQM